MNANEKLLHLMELRDRTQAQLVRETGIAQSKLSDVCNGKRRLQLDEAAKLARILDVSLEWLANDAIGLPPPVQPSEQKELLKLIDDLGYTVAKARLLGVPEVRATREQDVVRRGGGGQPPRKKGKDRA